MAGKNILENFTNSENNNMINNIKNTIHNKINNKISHKSTIKSFNKYIDSLGNDTEKLNIELSSEFILFISTLMRIKAKMLLPRKELDADGNEIDPRMELVDKILEYKKFKEASIKLAEWIVI
jgi:chromatin segregation and condensation protein Rec8/ScpA/Scc1 (kleisin family)